MPWHPIAFLTMIAGWTHILRHQSLRGGCFSSQRPSDPSAFTTSSATRVTWVTRVTRVMRMRAMAAMVQCIVLGTTDTMDTMDTMGTRGTMGITSTRHNMWTIMNIADMSMSGITNRQAMTWDKALMNPHSSCITNTILRVVMKVMLSFHMLAMTTTEVMSPLSR